MYDTHNNDLYIPKNVAVPVELYESMKGDYFIGYADNLTFGNNTSAWARLYNPPYSGVNLHVNVWTVTDISNFPFRAQFWFNAQPPAGPYSLAQTTTTNTAIWPQPVPKVQLQLASDVSGDPVGGIKAYVRRGQPESTLVETENGKLIFPPCGSFLVYLSLAENPTESAEGRIAFGWYEEKIKG